MLFQVIIALHSKEGFLSNLKMQDWCLHNFRILILITFYTDLCNDLIKLDFDY